MSTRRVKPTFPPSNAVLAHAQGTWHIVPVAVPNVWMRLDTVYEQPLDDGTVTVGVATGPGYPVQAAIPMGSRRLAMIIVYPSAPVVTDETITDPEAVERIGRVAEEVAAL